MELFEKELSSELVYQGSFLKVYKDRVALPDEHISTREYIQHPGAVAILALTAGGELILERQYRYPARCVFIEIPAGKIDAGEAPLSTAQRELLEETGYSAASWTYLGSAHPCIAYSDEMISYYVAEDLTFSARQLDEGEFLEVFTQPVEQVLAMALTGEICDSKSIVGLHWLAAYLAGKMPVVNSR
ncbi:NUDIX hydrolase [Neisseriaceae bacterium TC5R-5]|nr:NUDIX hydrolase [Neisseriaceae bacterium TC5R-5]